MDSHRPNWVINTTYVEDWLVSQPDEIYERIVAVLRQLAIEGPQMKRPYVGKIEGSTITNLKELRPLKNQRDSMRILFLFDPTAIAILLVAGNKAGNWKTWYKQAIPLAEQRYDHYKNTNI